VRFREPIGLAGRTVHENDLIRARDVRDEVRDRVAVDPLASTGFDDCPERHARSA